MHNMSQQDVNVEPRTGSTTNFASAWLARRHGIPFHLARVFAELAGFSVKVTP